MDHGVPTIPQLAKNTHLKANLQKQTKIYEKAGCITRLEKINLAGRVYFAENCGRCALQRLCSADIQIWFSVHAGTH